MCLHFDSAADFAVQHTTLVTLDRVGGTKNETIRVDVRPSAVLAANLDDTNVQPVVSFWNEEQDEPGSHPIQFLLPAGTGLVKAQAFAKAYLDGYAARPSRDDLVRLFLNGRTSWMQRLFDETGAKAITADAGEGNPFADAA